MSGLRTFDTFGTTLRRVGKVLTITCEDDETANRVANELRTDIRGESFSAAENRSEGDRISEIRSEVPAHRIVQREVIDWANSLNGRAPIGEDLSRLIQSLAGAVETDRHLPGAAQGAQVPVAWVVFAENGNVRLWGKERAGPEAFAKEKGLVCEPLYRAAQPPAAPVEAGDLNSRLGIGLLWAVHSALDEALGDSDVTHIEDDAELRKRHPVQWAAQHLAQAISLLEDDQPAAVPVEKKPPFIMLSCREAKQCLHQVPGCICEGDPTLE